jgi:CBS domain-containing protein
MNVGKICRRQVVTLLRSDEVATAAQLMRARHIGYIVVVDPGAADHAPHPIGVLTDRDIVVTVVARDMDTKALCVADIMTSQPVTVCETDTVDAALREMRRVGVRRLPVVGQRGELTGILSLDDVLDALAAQLQSVAGSIHKERAMEGALRP